VGIPGQIVWAKDAAIERLCDDNLGQHRAIRAELAARSAQGARKLARGHVKFSLALFETIPIKSAQPPANPPG
jgi:DNA-binding GntR family transcriptional regulator